MVSKYFQNKLYLTFLKTKKPQKYTPKACSIIKVNILF